MHLSPNKRFYSYPSNKYNLEMYAGGSLLGIMSQYVFTDKGIDDLNIWMAELGTEEITQDRKVELEARFNSILAGLLTSGDAVKKQNNEVEITAKYWETVSSQD